MKKLFRLLMIIDLFFAAALVFPAMCGATVVTGEIGGLLESGDIFTLDEFVDPSTGIRTYWSIGSLDPDFGYLYSNDAATTLALVTGVDAVNEIGDASIYDYRPWNTGIVREGDFVLFHNNTTGYYAALHVKDIWGSLGEMGGAYSTYLDGTWYLQDDRTANFAGAVPLPGTFILLGGGLAILAGGTKRKKKIGIRLA